MSYDRLAKWLRENWYLAALLLVVLAGYRLDTSSGVGNDAVSSGASGKTWAGRASMTLLPLGLPNLRDR